MRIPLCACPVPPPPLSLAVASSWYSALPLASRCPHVAAVLVCSWAEAACPFPDQNHLCSHPQTMWCRPPESRVMFVVGGYVAAMRRGEKGPGGFFKNLAFNRASPGGCLDLVGV